MTEKLEEQTTEDIHESVKSENPDIGKSADTSDSSPNSDNGTGSNTDEPVDNSDDTDGGKLHREAAKYRTQLRETETALETMTRQRNALASMVVEQNLPAHVSPKVFWKLADDVTEYIADDGTLDLDKVKTAAETIADDLGLSTGPMIPGQEKRPGKVNTGNRLQQAFEPR